jgi:hypothetical protein
LPVQYSFGKNEFKIFTVLIAMKKILTLCFSIILLTTGSLWAQFPVKLDVGSNGAISYSPATKLGAVYRITVSGTYSMWPQFADCHGVDGAYVYDVPQEEIDNFRWPPPDIFGIPFVELPHWVGDPTVYAFPPKELGGTPLFEMSFRKNTGFRINGEPLPNTGTNYINHTYTIEKTGTGKPIELQILDSNYNISQLKMIPRYEDNCGALSVTIQEISSDTAYKLEICSEKIIYEGDQAYLVISLKLYKGDDPDTSTNLIGETDTLTLRIGNKYEYKTTYKCTGGRSPIDVMFLLDNSGSMLAGPGKNDTIQRIDAAIAYIESLMNPGGLVAADSVSIAAFRDKYQLLVGWNPMAYVNANLPSILYNVKAGWKTGLAEALGKAIGSFPNTARKKALFVLSDYYDNTTDIIDISKVRDFDGMAFLLNFGMGGNKTDTSGAKNLSMLKSIFTNSSIYNYPDFISVVTDLANFAGSRSNTDCCEYKIPFDPCLFNKDTTIVMDIVFTAGNSVYSFSQTLFLDCKTDTTEPGLIRNLESVAVKRDNNFLRVETGDDNTETRVRIIDLNGRELIDKKITGTFNIALDSLQNGMYFIVSEKNGMTHIQKFIIY